MIIEYRRGFPVWSRWSVPWLVRFRSAALKQTAVWTALFECESPYPCASPSRMNGALPFRNLNEFVLSVRIPPFLPTTISEMQLSSSSVARAQRLADGARWCSRIELPSCVAARERVSVTASIRIPWSWKREAALRRLRSEGWQGASEVHVESE